jgi:protein-disulfide isomerase
MLHIAQRIGLGFGARQRQLCAARQFMRLGAAHASANRQRARGMASGCNGLREVFAGCCLLLLFCNLAAIAQSANAASSTPSNEGTVLEQAIHDYILAHPEVLIESLQQAKAKAEQRRAELIKSRIIAFGKTVVDDPNVPILGNPKGDVTLVEFFDYRCPYCRQVEPWVQTLLKEDPGVRLVEMEFPILGPASIYAAQVALAAWKQEKHTAFRNALMAKEGNMDEGSIDEELVLQVAKSVGLDMDRMKVDMKSSDVEGEIRDNMRIGQSLGLTGTPAFIIGAELVPGATDLATLREMVVDARQRHVN